MGKCNVNNVDSFIIYFFFISFYLYSIQAIFRECFWSFFLFQMKVRHFIKSHTNFSLYSVIPHHHRKMCCLMVYPISRTRLSLTFEITIIFYNNNYVLSMELFHYKIPSLILVRTLFAFIFEIFHFQSHFFHA
jgi:hypothetical protein